jgi:hypothetical protein
MKTIVLTMCQLLQGQNQAVTLKAIARDVYQTLLARVHAMGLVRKLRR